MHGTGRQSNLTSPWRSRLQQALRDAFQSRSRDPTEGRKQACPTGRNGFGEHEKFVEAIRVSVFDRTNSRDKERTRSGPIERLVHQRDPVSTRDLDTIQMGCDSFVDPAQLKQAYVRRTQEHRAHVTKVR